MRRLCVASVALGMLFAWDLGADPPAGSSPVRLPMPQDVDAARLESDYLLVVCHPREDPRVAFDVGIPKGWSDLGYAGEGPAGYVNPSTLGHWQEAGEPGRAPELEVSEALLPFSMRPEEWLESAARRWNWTLLERRLGEQGGRRMAEVLARAGAADVPRVVRMAAIRDDDRLFLVAGCCVENDYARCAEPFAAAIRTFRLRADRTPPPQDTRIYTVRHPIVAVVGLPASWRFEGADRLLPGHGLAFARPPGDAALFGLLRLHLAAPSLVLSEREAVELALRSVRTGGFEPMRRTIDLPVGGDGHPPGRFLLYEGMALGVWMELRVVTFAGRAGRVTISAYSPSPAVAVASWRECRRAFETAMFSVQIAESAVQEPSEGATTGPGSPAEGK
ncbi:MAG: hypothetical protein HYZ53_29285 [Planctomycetes bacterium]|nr:hypothetical protein [Planctomycetota bacterium]